MLPIRKLNRAGLALAACVCFLAGVGWGYVSLQFQAPPYATAQAVWRAAGAWIDPWAFASGPFIHYARSERADESAQRPQLLETLGYLGAVRAATTSGISIHDPAGSFPGPRLLTLGSAPEAELVSVSGEVLHRWRLDYRESFPDKQELLANTRGARLWRRIHLLDDGGLLAVHDYIGLVRLDRDSKRLWAITNGAHHAVVPSGSGTFFCLIAKPERVSWFDPGRDVLHDFIVEIDAHGREIRRISLLEALRDSPYASLLERAAGEDPLHTNTLKTLDGSLAEKLPAFREGALLVSFRDVDAIAVVDWEQGAVTWALSGMFRGQHEPTPLANGRLLLFDNLGDGGRSRVLEFDPATQRIHWMYNNRVGDLFSRYCGVAQRLPNGNTLITETDEGRVIETTPQGRIVWEYRTPHRHGNLVARVLEALALESAPSWLTESQGARLAAFPAAAAR